MPRSGGQECDCPAPSCRVADGGGDLGEVVGHGGGLDAGVSPPRPPPARADQAGAAEGQDPPYYPIADAIASHITVWSPANGCGPCSITCSLSKFPWESRVSTIEKNPASFTKVSLCEV
jgi:hypothetical protein